MTVFPEFGAQFTKETLTKEHDNYVDPQIIHKTPSKASWVIRYSTYESGKIQ